MINITFALALLFVIIALILLILLFRQKKSFGILGVKNRIYQDTKQTPGFNIYSKSLPLVGKPDYLIKDGKYIIPVEIKDSNAPRGQYQNNVMQLMAYCLLVEEHYGIRPPGGFIQYRNAEMKFAYTKEAEKSVRLIVEEILQCKKSNKEPHCTHVYHNNL